MRAVQESTTLAAQGFWEKLAGRVTRNLIGIICDLLTWPSTLNMLKQTLILCQTPFFEYSEKIPKNSDNRMRCTDHSKSHEIARLYTANCREIKMVYDKGDVSLTEATMSNSTVTPHEPNRGISVAKISVKMKARHCYEFLEIKSTNKILYRMHKYEVNFLKIQRCYLIVFPKKTSLIKQGQIFNKQLEQSLHYKQQPINVLDYVVEALAAVAEAAFQIDDQSLTACAFQVCLDFQIAVKAKRKIKLKK